MGPRLELPMEMLVLLRVKGAPGGGCQLKGGPGSSLPTAHGLPRPGGGGGGGPEPARPVW